MIMSSNEKGENNIDGTFYPTRKLFFMKLTVRNQDRSETHATNLTNRKIPVVKIAM